MDKKIYEKERKIVTAATIITAIYLCFLFYEEFIFFFVVGQIVTIILGINAMDEKSDFVKVRRNLIICAIVSVTHLNFLNMILYIWASESYENKYRKQMLMSHDLAKSRHKNKTFVQPKEKISDEAKKIDILLKIGVFLVILSGVIFATSNTGPVIDLFKPFFILLLSGIFYVLSIVFKTKVKIKKSENTYYILSQIFIIFFAVALGYFKTFGTFLSFDGEGEKLVYSFIILLSSLISRNLGKRYENSELHILSYLCIYASVGFSLSYFKVSLILIASILLVLSIIGFFKISYDNESYHDSRMVLMFILGFYILCYNFTVDDTEMLFNGFLGIGLFISNMYFSTKKYEETIFKQILMFSSVVFTNMCLYNLGDILFHELYFKEGIANIPFYASLITLGFHHYFVNKNEYKTGGFIITALLIVFNMINMVSESCNIVLFITSLVLLVYSIMNIYKNEDETLQKVYFGLQIFLIGSLIGSGQSILRDYFNCHIVFGTTVLLYLSVIAMVDIFEDKFISKIKFDIPLYYILIFTLGVFNIIFMNSNSLVFNLIFLVVLIGYRVYVNKHIKNNDLVNCMLIITTFLQLEHLLLKFIPVYTSPILFVLLIVTAILFRKDKLTCVFCGSLAYIPVLAMIDYFDLPSELELILYSFPLLLIVQLVSNMALDLPTKAKMILETIAMILIMFICIFEVNIIIGLYVGVLSLIMIFIGTKNDRFNSLFYTGIIVLILNIIVQLFEYWERIPWFVYTLIAGLGIIFYVTYKEFNKDKKPKVKETKVEYYEVKEYNIRNNIVTVCLFFVYLFVMCIYAYNIDVIKQQHLNLETEKKVLELGLNQDIYYFSNKNYPIFYILEGNSTDISKVYNVINDIDNSIYDLHVCWVDSEGMNKAKTTNNNNRYYNRCLDDLYYYGYEDKPDTSYSIKGFTLNVLEKDLYGLSIWRNSSYLYEASFDVSYNKYESDGISFCINHANIEDYNIYIDADEYYELDDDYCYKAWGDYENFNVNIEKKPITPSYEYNPETGETIYFN